MDSKLEIHNMLLKLLQENKINELYDYFKKTIDSQVNYKVIAYNFKKQDREELQSFANLTFLLLLKRFDLKYNYYFQDYIKNALQNHLWKQSLILCNYNNVNIMRADNDEYNKDK